MSEIDKSKLLDYLNETRKYYRTQQDAAEAGADYDTSARHAACIRTIDVIVGDIEVGAFDTEE